jgi:MarR family transcriptional regulator for hemolysin
VEKIDNWHPEQMPTLTVGRIGRMLLKLDDERLKPVGITSSQLPVLVALKHGERLTQKELTRIAGVEQPSMAQLLARMERDNLVLREPSKDDRRSNHILLTDYALGQLEPGRDALRQIDTEACAGFSDAEKETLVALLARLAANIEGAINKR